MRYIKRELENKFLRMSDFFKVVLVTGARQVGKTTMLKHLAEGTNRQYVSLDNLQIRNLAITDPDLFFQTYKPPLLIDEVQYAPELFDRIKVICDGTKEAGLFWLTGSQQYAMMKNVRQSLAGRIGILQLYSLSHNEKQGHPFDSDFELSVDSLMNRQILSNDNNVVEVFEHIWCGGMPQVLEASPEQREAYFDSYVQSYIMRDAAELGGVTDSLKFGKFITACAALTAEQVNYHTLAEASSIAESTAKEWLTLLEGMGIVYLLQPYSNNELKRLAKTPKLYFCDTGLCAYLSMWLTADALRCGAANGHYFENFVVTELIKNFACSRSKQNLTYYRDSNAKEIDIVIEENNTLHPFEIKLSASPDSREAKKFGTIDKTSLNRGFGGIICMCETLLPIDEKNYFIPCNLI